MNSSNITYKAHVIHMKHFCAGLFLILLIFEQFPDTNSQLGGCEGFGEIRLFSGTSDRSASFSWRFLHDDGGSVNIILPSGDIVFPTPTVVPPTSVPGTDTYTYSFPPGNSTVVKPTPFGSDATCSFDVLNFSPCTFDPCSSNQPCIENEELYICSCQDNQGCLDSAVFKASDQPDLVFVAENGNNHDASWFVKGDVSSVYVKYPGEEFAAAVPTVQEGFFKFSFVLGVARVYLFGSGGILLSSFDVTILDNPCFEKPCSDNFICVVNNEGDLLYRCECLVDLSFVDCNETDLSRCHEEVCNLDSHQCIETNNGFFECRCKPGLQSTASGPCEAAYLGFTMEFVSVSEGKGIEVLDLRLTRALATAIFIDINITDITASRGTDYFIPDSIELTAGVQNGAIAITIIRDNLIEDLESFTVEIVNVSSPAVINSGRVIVTIEDDDFATVCFPDGTISVNESEGVLVIPLQITPPLLLQNDVIVVLQLTDVNATRGEDYEGNEEMIFVTIPMMVDFGGEIDVNIDIIDDLVFEETETFLVTITEVSQPLVLGVDCPRELEVLILDDDHNECDLMIHDCDPVSSICVDTPLGFRCDCTNGFVAVNDICSLVDVIEPTINGCSDDIIIDVISGSSGEIVVFPVPTATDNSGSVTLIDHTHDTGDFFPLGVTEVSYVFRDPSGNVAVCSFLITLQDRVQEMVTLDVSSSVVREGETVEVIVNLSSALDSEDIVVSLLYQGINATENADYQITTSSVLIGAGQVTATSSVVILDDDLIETAETFVVSIVEVTDSVIVSPTMNTLTITISDDDFALPVLQISPTSVEEESNEPVFTITAVLNKAFQYDDTEMEFFTEGCAFSLTDVANTSLINRVVVPSGSLVSDSLPFIVLDDFIVDPEMCDFSLRLIDVPNVTLHSMRFRIVDTDTAIIMISPDRTTITEGEDIVYNIELSTSIEHYDLSIDFETLFGSQSNFRSVTIPAGSLSTSIRFLTEDDELRQLERSFDIIPGYSLICASLDESECEFAILPDSTQVSLEVTEQRVTVLENDKVRVGFAVGEFFVQEGNGSAFIPLTLIGFTQSSDFPFTVAFNYILGSAVTSDFRSTQRELIYDRRDMRFLQVPIVQDDEVEDDETFFISMSISPSPNIEIAVPRIGVNIIDDDGVRVFLSAPSSDVSVREDEETVTITFVLSEALATDVIFTVRIIEGTASIDRDFETDIISYTIPAGQLSSVVDIAINNDLAVEANEYFTLFLNSTSENVNIDRSSSTVTISIEDDDSINDIELFALSSTVTVNEDANDIDVMFLLNNAVEEGEIFIEISTEDITATKSRDYSPRVQDAIFLPPGMQTAVVPIRILADSTPEESESFRISIVSTEPALDITSATMTVFINDDDESCAQVNSVTVKEDIGNVDIIVAVPRRLETDVTIGLRPISQSAISEEDFGAVLRSVTIPAGEGFTRFTISIINDNIREQNETFLIEITDVTFPASLCDHTSTGTITILANDQGPQVDFCSDDIEVQVAPSITTAFVRWSPARFSVNGIDVESRGPSESEDIIPVGASPKLITYTAFDEEQAISICEFTISAIVINDFRTYSVSMEVDTNQGSPEEDIIFEELNDILRRGSCWRDYAGIEVHKIEKSEKSKSRYTVSYRLFLLQMSRCCIRDIINEANEDLRQVGNSLGPAISARPSTHLPDFTEIFFTTLRLTSDNTIVDPNIYGDPTKEEAQDLHLSLITQITDGLSSEMGFSGVCIPQPFRISSVLVDVILESREQDSSVTSFQQRLRNVIRNGMSLPTGLSAPPPASIILEDLCQPATCSGRGSCVVNSDLRKFRPDCICDRGFLGSNCSVEDPAFCHVVVYELDEETRASDEFLTINAVGAVGESLTSVDLENLNINPCRDFRDEEFLNFINITCVRKMNMAAAWIYSLQCDATLDEFLSYLQQNITIVPDNVEDISMQLANATNLFDNSGTNTSLVLTAEIINNIANINSSSPRVTGNVTVTVSNVLNGEDMVLAESYVNGTTTMLIEAFERQLQMVETDSDGIYSQSSENVIVMINDGSPTMLDGFGIATLEVENDDNEDETQTFEEFMVFDSSVQNVQQIVNQSSSLLLYPSQISQNFLSTDSIRIANTVYRRPNLFSSRYYDNINNEFSKYQRRIKRRLVPNTRVISSTLYRNGNEFLTWNRSRGSGNENSTFQQWYLPLQEGGRRAILESSLCSFWNFRADGGRGNWSTDGCRLVSAGSDGMVNCECTHLTNFAVLMDVYDGDSLTETQLLILDAMTFFGCGASILGLLLTILAFSTDSKLRSKRPNHILLGLSTSLTILYVTFLIMALLDSERKKVFLNDVPCTLLAAFMQFSLLSALSWMTVESVLMFYLFVRVFNTAAAATRGFLLKAFAFALGVPLLIVGATYGITTWAGGQYIRKDVCFLSATWTIIGGVGVPIFIMLVINTVLYIRIMLNINKRVQGKSSNEKRERRKRIQHAVAIFLLLGLTWGLGYACYIPAGNIPAFVFQMLFVTVNSMQGYLIFMLYCMRNPTFRKKWRKLCFLCPDRPLTSTFSYKSSDKKTIGDNIASGKFRPSNVPFSSVERRRIL